MFKPNLGVAWVKVGNRKSEKTLEMVNSDFPLPTSDLHEKLLLDVRC